MSPSGTRTTRSRPTMVGSRPGCSRCADSNACAQRAPSPPGTHSCRTCAAGTTRSPRTCGCTIASATPSTSSLGRSERRVVPAIQYSRALPSLNATAPGLLLNGLVALVNQTFSVRNGLTPAGIHQPSSSLRSGGPGSLVSWNSLGREGRKFVATGPSAADIQSWTDERAEQPIRAYAGLESAGTSEARAALAVSDLERAGGFKRKNLLVVTTTDESAFSGAYDLS